MLTGSLYNGEQLPEYIFDKKVSGYVFIDFDVVFSGPFWALFKEYLLKNSCQKITIKNLKPELFSFSEEISTKELPDSFLASTCKEKPQDYIKGDASFYMLTEQGLIYSEENKPLFCLFLHREYTLGILGFSNSADVNTFNEYSIKNINDFLVESFVKIEMLNFRAKFNQNWKLNTLN